MQQQFEHMFKVMGDVRDHLERHNDAINILQSEPWRKRQPTFVNNEYDGGDDIDDDQVTLSGQDVNSRRQTRRGRFDGVDRNIGCIKMKIPHFQGKNNPNVYLELEQKMELIFEYHNYSKEKKVKLVVIEFYDYIIIWWDQLCKNKSRNGERPMETWLEIKQIMRRRFVRSHYYRDLHQRLQTLTQSSMSIDKYHKEMEIAMIRANVKEDREATIGLIPKRIKQEHCWTCRVVTLCGDWGYDECGHEDWEATQKKRHNVWFEILFEFFFLEIELE